MRGELRLGLAGCGRIAARGYLPSLLGRAGGLRLAALADRDRARAEELAAACAAAGCPVEAFGDPAEMIEACSLDGLAIATPAATHAEIAALAAAAGLPCLVEKPPAASLDGARALAALSPPVAIGFNRRFLQGRELADRVPAGGWLELRLELRFRRDAWGAHSARDEALLDAGLHMIDLAAFLTGSPPIAVRGARLSRERAELELELGRGRAAIRCATDRRYAELVEVRDRGGARLASHRLGALRARLRAMRGAEPLAASICRQLEAFAASVRGETAAGLAGPRDAVAALAAAEAARRSASLGGAEIPISVAAETAPLGAGA